MPDMNDPQPRPEPTTSLGPDEPMSDEMCTFVLSLSRDGRSLHPRLVERAEAWADQHPACRRALTDFAIVGGVLAAEPSRQATQGFTERVLAEQRRVGRPGEVLPLLRRLSMAAAVLLGLTLAFDLSFPAGAAADDELARQAHRIDVVRPDPFVPADLDAGLRALLPDATPLGSVAPQAPKPGVSR